MLVIRGVNVFPSAVEAALLDDPALAGQYALVVDQRQAMHQLEVHTELIEGSADRDAVAARLGSARVWRTGSDSGSPSSSARPAPYRGRSSVRRSGCSCVRTITTSWPPRSGRREFSVDRGSFSYEERIAIASPVRRHE
jgi:hypothetical protein